MRPQPSLERESEINLRFNPPAAAVIIVMSRKEEGVSQQIKAGRRCRNGQSFRFLFSFSYSGVDMLSKWPFSRDVEGESGKRTN